MKAANIKDARNINSGEITKQPRGFRLQKFEGKEYYLRIGFVPVACTGEAHTNAFVDNCGSCLGGVWGVRAVRA